MNQKFTILLLVTFFCLSSCTLLSESQIKKLTAYLHNEAYRKTIPKTLYNCATGSPSYSEADCLIAKYIFHVSQFEDPLPISTNNGRERPLKIDLVGPEVSYNSQLEDYILKSRPFKTKCKSCKANPYQSLLAEAQPSTEFPWLYTLQKTANISNQVPIPAIAYNSYYRKFNNRYTYYFQEILSADCFFTPCVVALTEGTATNTVFQCPAHAHTLLWSPTIHLVQEDGTISPIEGTNGEESTTPKQRRRTTKNTPKTAHNQLKLRLFDEQRHGKAFGPKMEVQPLPFQSLRTKTQYTMNGWEDTNNTHHNNNQSIPFHTTITLSNDPEEMLFIPGNYLYSLYHEKKSEEVKEAKKATVGHVMMLCFHDSSNLQSLRMHFHEHEYLSRYHAELFDYVNTVRSFSSSSSEGYGLDFMNMEKYPQDFTLSQFHFLHHIPTTTTTATATATATATNDKVNDVESNKEEKQNDDTPAVAAEVVKEDTTSTSNTNRRNRRKNRQTTSSTTTTTAASSNGNTEGMDTNNNNNNNKAKDFRTWQDSIAWKLLIEQLTLPMIPSQAITIPSQTIQRQSLQLHYEDRIYFNTIKPALLLANSGNSNSNNKALDGFNAKHGIQIVLCPHNITVIRDEQDGVINEIHLESILYDNAIQITKKTSVLHGIQEEYLIESVATSSTVPERCIETIVYHNAPEVIEKITSESITIPIDVPSFDTLKHDFQHEVDTKEKYLLDNQKQIFQEVIQYTIDLTQLQANTRYQYKLAIVIHQTQIGPSTSWSDSKLIQTKPFAIPSSPLPPTQEMLDYLYHKYNPLSSSSVATTTSTSLLPRLLFATSMEVMNIIPAIHFGFTSIPVLASEIFFQLPKDNGGSSIVGYIVYQRIQNNMHSYSSWSYKGVFPLQSSPAALSNHNEHSSLIETMFDGKLQSIVAYNLLPYLKYEFKIVAFNTIGESSYSIKSNVVAYNDNNDINIHSINGVCEKEQQYNVYGKGHEAYYGSQTMLHYQQSDLIRKKPLSIATIPATATNNGIGMYVEVQEKVYYLLDILAETLTVYSVDHHSYIRAKYETISLWRSAWSPKITCGSLIGQISWLFLHAEKETMEGYFEGYFAISLAEEEQLLRLEEEDKEGKEQEENIYSESASLRMELEGKIVIMGRNGFPFYQAALLAQRFNALALVIVDMTKECVSFDEKCLPGANHRYGEGFAAMDIPKLWSTVKLPVYFMLHSAYITLEHEKIKHEAYLESKLHPPQQQSAHGEL